MKTLDTQTVLIDLHYLPCLEFFACVLNFDEIILESNENYTKQSYRNRCYLQGSNKIEMLTIPVIDGNKKVIIKDVKIDYSQRWEIIHWRTITAAYGKSPFFEFFADYFQDIYQKGQKQIQVITPEYSGVQLKMQNGGIKKALKEREKELKSLTGIGAGVHVDMIKKSDHKFDFKFNQDCPGVSFQKDEKSVTQILGHFFTFFNFSYSYILF